MMVKQILSAALTGIVLSACGSQTKKEAISELKEGELIMLAGTYTSGESKGIYTYSFNQDNGESKLLTTTAIENPSFLDITGDNRFVYAVSENDDGSETVNSFEFTPSTGTLKQIGHVPARGGAPCYVSTNGKYTITANYNGGNIAVFPVNPDGSLSPAVEVYASIGKGADPKRQQKPHLHCVRFSPDGKFIFATDLGTDRIYRYALNNAPDAEKEESVLTPAEPFVKVAPGSGPRHLTFSPNGTFAYLINELSGTVVAFSYAEGMLNEIQTVEADTVGAKGSADIHISPDGKYLYASNRLKADGIAIFKINAQDGLLEKVGYQLTGLHPRNFIITPNGNFLLVACRDSNAIEIYKRDQTSGLLTDTEKRIVLDKPVCIKFAWK